MPEDQVAASPGEITIAPLPRPLGRSEIGKMDLFLVRIPILTLTRVQDLIQFQLPARIRFYFRFTGAFRAFSLLL
jgi:hypothetical protein